MSYAYQAFISYSHAADGKLAPALQSALQQFAKPWTRLRAVRVFRDKTGLAVTPGLWSSISTALDSSEYFLLLASPDAARSYWVDQEVQHWLSQPRAERLLIILTGGEIVWDPASRTLDATRTTALPPSLRTFAEEPLWLDLRWARSGEHLSFANPSWREAIADLSSTLRGLPKDQLIGEDVRQHARATRFRRAAIAGLATLAVGMAAAAWIALGQRDLAREQARIALARQLAAQAQLIRAQDPERLPLALLMAAEATQRHGESLETQQTLHAVVSSFPLQLAAFEHPSSVMATALSPDLTLLATAAEKGAGALWRISAPGAKPIASLEGADRRVLWSPDGKRIAGCCARVGVWAADGTRQLERTPQDLSGLPESIAFSPDSRLLAIGVSEPRPGALVFDIETGQEVFRHRIELSGRTAAMAFAPNGDLAVALRNKVEMFSAAAWQPLRTWESAAGSVDGLAISPNGRYLAYATREKVTAIDLKEGTSVAQLEVRGTGPGENEYLGFIPNGRYLGAVGHLNTGAIWRVDTWREVVAVRHAEFQTIHALSFDPAVAEAVSCGADGHCIGWSLESGREIHRFAHRHPYTGEEARMRQLFGGAFGARDSLFASGGGDRTARLWNLQPPGEMRRSQCEGDLFVRVWSPPAGRSWNKELGGLQLVPRQGCGVPRPQDVRQEHVVAGPRGEYAAAVVPSDIVRVWQTAGATPVAQIEHTDPVDWDAVERRLRDAGMSLRPLKSTISMMQAGSVSVLALAPTATYLATYRRADRTLRIWDVRGAKVIHAEVLERPPVLEFLSDTLLLRIEEPQKLSMLQLPDRTPKWSAELRDVTAITVSDDSKFIAAAARSGARSIVRVWDATSGAALLERDVDAKVDGLAFDRAGRYLATALGDQPMVPSGFPPGVGLKVWEISSGREALTAPQSEKLIAFDFSHDSKRLAAVSSNGTLGLWDLASGRASKTVLANPGPLAFSASGKWIAVGNGSIRVLDTAALRPIAHVEFATDTRRIEFVENDRALAVDTFDAGETRGVRQLRRWQPADMLSEACRRLPGAAQRQWQQLYPERSAPVPCPP